MKCSSYRVGSDWAFTVDVGSANRTEQENDPVAIHYVIDNSGSMGSMTTQVRDIFSNMVDSVATAPCSLTVFHDHGQVLSSNIQSAKEMRNKSLPPQGRTNIPAGVHKALRIVCGQEMKHLKSRASTPRTHHIMILLSDGQHNVGGTPEKIFPTLGSEIPEGTKLSVIVVGFSEQSSTSMGMLLKESVETSTFDADAVKTIYFAKTQTALRSALANLESGLNIALNGRFHEVKIDTPSIIQDFASEPQDKVIVHMKPGSTSFTLLAMIDEPPKAIVVDGETVPVAMEESMAFESLSTLIQGLIDRTKVRIVASKNGAGIISKSVARLKELHKVLQAKKPEEVSLDLTSLSAKDRVKQYREIRRLTHAAGELKNQILDIENFSNTDSAGQASFLNGRSMKFANKALRRAADRQGQALNPKAEREAMAKLFTSDAFVTKLRAAMFVDAVENLKRLSDEQIRSSLFSVVEKSRQIDQIWEIRRKAAKRCLGDVAHDADSLGLSTGAANLISSGKLSDFLNDAFHGKRQSFVSMATPWQHIEEWTQFQDQDFESSWEMLMYGGFVGYPLFVSRSSASQMNPYLLQVDGVRSSLVDSASICCANQAEFPVYGPEAGKPIEDVLVLIDPSMPSSSKIICNSALLGEKFTSATIARDLHMYSGINMRIALHANTLFHLTSSVDETAPGEDDVVADLRRAFLGRAFMCPICKFGPVDHFACGDLMAHHGESVQNSKISNCCPECNWFSPYISDWLPWDGNVATSFLISRMSSPDKKQRRPMLSESRIDLILRVLYSVRKLCRGSQIWSEYEELVNRMIGSELDFSTKAGVDGLSQLSLALLATLSEADDGSQKNVLDSTDVLIAILKEACARDANKRFRQRSGGNKEMARQEALDCCTKLLGIDKYTAPDTLPQMEPEPPLENVCLDCRDDYQVDAAAMQQVIPWIRDVCRQWCRVWSVAKSLSSILVSRDGGWDQLEKDMETSISSYQDVVDKLKETTLATPRDVLFPEMSDEDPSVLQNFFINMAVEAIAYGAGAAPKPKEEDEDLLSHAAREMRMRIYFERVSEKMALWKAEGEQATFMQARAADIVQFTSLITRSHVHGLDKQTFWGLWNAALHSKDQAKIEAFLATTNTVFRGKHGDVTYHRHRNGNR